MSAALVLRFLVLCAVLVASGFAFKDSWARGDLLTLEPSASEQLERDHAEATRKLESTGRIVEGIYPYFDTYSVVHELDLKPELKLAQADKKAYCLEITIRGRVWHRSGPGEKPTIRGFCPIRS